jgi:hypothetical protein
MQLKRLYPRSSIPEVEKYNRQTRENVEVETRVSGGGKMEIVAGSPSDLWI